MSYKLKHHNHKQLSNFQQIGSQNQHSISNACQQSLFTDPNLKQSYGKCECEICQLGKTVKKSSKSAQYPRQKHLLEQFIHCLIDSRNVIDVNIPHICFFRTRSNGTLWRTNMKTGFVEKETTIITERNLYAAFRKYKLEYKESLGEDQEAGAEPTKGEINQLEYNKILPSVRTRMERFQQKKLVLYKNKQERNPSETIQKENQFCLVKYIDGNFQLMSQIQFRHFVSHFVEKFPFLDYVKGYIRPKSPSQSTILIVFDQNQIDNIMYTEVGHQIAYCLDEIISLDPKHLDTEQYKLRYCQSQLSTELYLKFKTYQMVIFIEKACLRKTKYMKIHWLLNEADTYYVYDILEWEYEDKIWVRQKQIDRKIFLQSCLDDKFPKIFANKARQSQSIRLYVPLPKSKPKISVSLMKVKQRMLNPESSKQLSKQLYPAIKTARKKGQLLSTIQKSYKLEPLRASLNLRTGKQGIKISKQINLASKLFN